MSAATVETGAVRRFSRGFPCLACGGHPDAARGKGVRCHGFISSDARYFRCSREDAAGAIPADKNGLFVHVMEGECRCGVTHRSAPDRQPQAKIKKRTIHATRERLRSAAEFSAEGKPVSAEYEYRGVDGALHLIVFRIDQGDGQKTFRQGRPEGDGYVLSASGATLVPFHLKELRAAIEAGDPVYICEGEKDVLAVENAGFPATCNPMGAGKDVSAYVKHFEGADIVRVVADRDDVGRKHARAWAEVLDGVARNLEIVEPVEGKDAHDALVVHKLTIERAFRAVEMEPRPPRELPTRIPFQRAWDLEEIEGLSAPYWVKGVIDAASTGYVFGKFSVGKTFLGLEIAAAVADGREFLGRRTRQALVFYSSGEGALGIRKRVRALRLEGRLQTDNLLLRDRAANLRDREQLANMIAAIRAEADRSELSVGLIFLDTQRRHMGAGDENPGPDTAEFFDAACELRDAFPGSSVVIVAHEGHTRVGVRGHSNQPSDADFMVRLAREPGAPVGRLSVEKTKDAEAGDPITYELRVVDLGVEDVDGDPLTSCVVDTIEVDKKLAAKPLNEAEQIVRNGLRELLGEVGGDPGVPHSAVTRGTLNQWVDGNTKVTATRRRGVVFKGLDGLKKRGLIRVEQEDIFLLEDLP